MSSKALLELKGVSKSYGDVVAVETVDFQIGRGEYIVLLGPSGSGKTTVLSMIGGFTTPTSGSILIAGEDVTYVQPADRPTVTVFQDYALFPHMSVAQNVEFGLVMHKIPKNEREKTVADALKLVGLSGFGDRRIHELSGGQRQRVALARAIAVKPTVLLLDEPLGALDMGLRRQMQDELVGIQKQLDTTFVHVTHDQEEAMNIADRIVVMNHGRIEDHGPPDRVYLHPSTRFSATFMGESNIFDARVVALVSGKVKVMTPLGEILVDGHASIGDQIHVSVRPEHFKLEATTERIPIGKATITGIAFNGTHRRCLVEILNQTSELLEILILLPVRGTFHEGDEIELFADPHEIVLLTD